MKARNNPLLWRRLTLSQKLLLIYFILLAVLGLPLALGALKLNLDQRRKAETVTIKATIPPNPFNTPNYKELYNKPPEIIIPDTVNLSSEVSLNVELLIIDPDWIPGLKPVATRFSSTKPLPLGLKILCKTQPRIKTCSLVGVPTTKPSIPQPLTIRATDALDAIHSKKIILR